MADFVAVLRKTVDALGDNTPEMREKVFDKARATIEAKLKAIQPPPPTAVVERQRRALEDAIAVIRADYARKAGPEPDQSLEDIFASLKSLGTPKVEPKPAPLPSAGGREGPPSAQPESRPYAPAAVRPASPAPAEPVAPVLPDRKPYEPNVIKAAPTPTPPAASEVPAGTKPVSMPKAPDPVLEDDTDDAPDWRSEPGRDPASEPVSHPRPERKRVAAGAIAAAVALLVFAAGGYGVWTNRDEFASLVGLGPQTPPAEEPAAVASDLVTPEPEAPAEAAETEAPQEEVIAALPPQEQPQPDASGGSSKFTQRLMPDGTEVDSGPAAGARTIGEGTSVAAATQAAGQETATDATDGSSGDVVASGDEPVAEVAQPTVQSASQTPSVAVGQRAIFYEERTTAASGSAEVGSIVWSVVQESPGGDLPPEPAIRAEATIPGKDIQLRMTIRRNGDTTLPASHIVEMIFLTPDGFEGGGISTVSRISFKETEQAAGNALIGIPAKIADGFFLIALGDAPAEIETNTTLLRRQSWIDIPITYASGRRALLSMEKGLTGDKVFQDTLRAWAESGSG